jgi:hypothetical protein
MNGSLGVVGGALLVMLVGLIDGLSHGLPISAGIDPKSEDERQHEAPSDPSATRSWSIVRSAVPLGNRFSFGRGPVFRSPTRATARKLPFSSS